MRTATSWSKNPDLEKAVPEAYDRLVAGLGNPPDVLFVNTSATADCKRLVALLRERAPDIPLHGSTSCLGLMTEEGFHSQDGFGLGLLGIHDPDGSYGTGMAPLGDDPKAATASALEQALGEAGQEGAVPALVWVTASPGSEEKVLQGIESYLGPNVPICGGSAADNTVSGEWKLFISEDIQDSAVITTVLFPGTDVYSAFHSGYEPTEHRGKVTRAEGRTVYEIDGRPAVEAYDKWTGGALSEHLSKPGNVLAHTTLYPLGRVVGDVAGVANYQLSHPDGVLEGGALTVFTDVDVGDEFVLMQGTPDSLASRAGRVATAALNTNDATADDVAGALIIYCAGCMLTIQERMNEVVKGLGEALNGAPFLGAFTFGEQGCFVGGENRHGNLMISVLIFSK